MPLPILYYWISFTYTEIGRENPLFGETVCDKHPFEKIREINRENVVLLNYRPINKREYDIWIKLNVK